MKSRVVDIVEKPLEYLKSFSISYLTRNGIKKQWEVASRGTLERLKNEVFDHSVSTDGSKIVAMSEDEKKLILVREFRPIAGKSIYSFPAGLIDEGESVEAGAVREFKEETGLDLTILGMDKPRYTSVGIINERVNTVYGYYSGSISQDHLEESEEIEALEVDREEALRLIREEEVQIRDTYLLRYFFDLPLESLFMERK